MNPLIQEKLASFSLDDYRPIHRRALDLDDPLTPKAGNLVKVVIGIRRCGKSYRLFQEMDRLLSMGVASERICYFNFEDERLAPVTTATGDEVLEAFFETSQSALSDGAYFFFDEIQAMEGWSAWLRRVVDSYKATIYVTGSSSKLLSSEVSTEFRGRALEYELYPYSFAECLSIAKGEDTAAPTSKPRPSKGPLSEAERHSRQRRLKDYLRRGGFPAVQDLPLERAVTLLQEYEERVVLKDIVEREGLSRPVTAVRFAQRLLAANGQLLSIRNSVRELKSIGVASSQEALRDLLDYFQNAFLAFRTRRYDRALVEKSNDLPKIYAIDPGLALACSSAYAKDLSSPLENAVYLELLRRTPGIRKNRVCYFKTRKGHEVDFVAGDALLGQPEALYQVTWELEDPKTWERETRSLTEALDEAKSHGAGTPGGPPLPEATIIVGEITPAELKRTRAKLKSQGGLAASISVVPAVEWLVES